MPYRSRGSLLTLFLCCVGCVPGEHDGWSPPFSCPSNETETDDGRTRAMRPWRAWLYTRGCHHRPTSDAGSAADADTPTACSVATYRPGDTYQDGDRVVGGGRLYACAPPPDSSGCATCSVEPPSADGGPWRALADCPLNDAGPVGDERPEVDGYYASPHAFILPAGSVGGATWQYTTLLPAGDWTASGYDVSQWQAGETGFFGGALTPADGPRTPWPDGATELWLRREVTLTACDLPQVMLWTRWDDGMTVYINGVEALREPDRSAAYRYLGLSAAARAALREGENVIAVHLRRANGGAYFDLGVTRFGVLTSRPVSGSVRTPALSVYGDTVRQFMIEHGIPAGVLAVMKHDQVVVSQGFGWVDKLFTRPLPHDAVLRLASNDKPFTLAAARTLIEQGTVDRVSGETITLDTRVFPLLRAHGLTPIPGATPAAALDDVTMQHLMEHRAGLQELPTPAQFYEDLQRAPGTTTAVDNVRWVYSQPPRFPPGSRELYSNAGYWVLRHLIGSVQGDVLDYLRDVVLPPVGTRDIFIASERLASRSPREPWYATFVAPYDRWVYLEDSTTMASSAEALVRFMRGYHLVRGTRLIDPVTGAWSYGDDNGWHVLYGRYEGTWTMALQRRWDEVNVAVLFNIDGNYDELLTRLHAITDSIPAADWTSSPL